MNFDTSLTDSKKAVNKIEVAQVYIGTPLLTGKFIVAKKQDVGEKRRFQRSLISQTSMTTGYKP
jgi:hypothetical protein